jgi:aldehyde:ferredoxin oxidoreductase
MQAMRLPARVDEAIIPYFEAEDNFPGPSGMKESLDRGEFLRLVDEYYVLRGWDKETGWPRREKLLELGLRDFAEELEKLRQ